MHSERGVVSERGAARLARYITGGGSGVFAVASTWCSRTKQSARAVTVEVLGCWLASCSHLAISAAGARGALGTDRALSFGVRRLSANVDEWSTSSE